MLSAPYNFGLSNISAHRSLTQYGRFGYELIFYGANRGGRRDVACNVSARIINYILR